MIQHHRDDLMFGTTSYGLGDLNAIQTERPHLAVAKIFDIVHCTYWLQADNYLIQDSYCNIRSSRYLKDQDYQESVRPHSKVGSHPVHKLSCIKIALRQGHKL